MKKGGTGGSHTARAGSSFEIKTDEDLMRELNTLGYDETILHKLRGHKGPIHGRTMELNTGETIEIYYKSGIYKLFFKPRGIDYRDYFSARLEPDTAIFSPQSNVLTIIEKKQMTTAGSVAEKLQTCDYKKDYYEKLVQDLGIKVEIKWVLGKYFEDQKAQLKSVYEYMLSKGSTYHFHKLPVNDLNI
jgi:hypothetical protein